MSRRSLVGFGCAAHFRVLAGDLLSLHPRRAKQGRLRPRPAFARRSYEPLALAFRRFAFYF